MKINQEDIEIAQILYEKMMTLPIGTEISVSELGRMTLEEGLLQSPLPVFEAWWPVMEALRCIMKADRKLRMDFTKHEFMCEGLPFNINFVLLKWGQHIYTNAAKIARKFAKANGLLGVKFLCYLYDKWVFQISHEKGVLSDPLYSPHYIIVSEDGVARFSTTEESVEIYKLTEKY